MPIETISGAFGLSAFAEAAFGRSTLTPGVSSGAVTMKMISSTSITSTSGVTLISASGW